ncbi:MAG: MlaE family lipid ABC transporter permease subunit [Candidatus Latescibacterota bacterium]|nr:MlaE family lipid ABC transporter permease subunit [Candidatus Latescibacterota bacterium]
MSINTPSHHSSAVFRLQGELTVLTVSSISARLRQQVLESGARELAIDPSGLTRLDTAGAVWLRQVTESGIDGARLRLDSPLPTAISAFYEGVSFPVASAAVPAERPRASFLERFGDRAYIDVNAFLSFLHLVSDLTWAGIGELWRRRGVRPGTFTEQATRVGADGVSIVAVILFLIGGVSTLQAAAQLRQFGANVLVADLLAIGITRELGPLMTAIMVAGRSGSAFAAEIATMKFTEEIDALRTMAIDPLRLIAVPKLWAMLLTVPLLTVMADFMGLLGGTVTGVVSLDIAPVTFVNRVTNALLLKDIVTGLIKSISFAWAITMVSVYRGLQFRGGAAGVGDATTASVVSSIFAIIVLDLAWGLLFYL